GIDQMPLLLDLGRLNRPGDLAEGLHGACTLLMKHGVAPDSQKPRGAGHLSPTWLKVKQTRGLAERYYYTALLVEQRTQPFLGWFGCGIGAPAEHRRGFIRMDLGKPRGCSVEQRRVGLEQDAYLTPLAPLAVPDIDRAHRRQDVGAGHQTLVKQRGCRGRSGLLVGERRPDQRAQRGLPWTCAPQAVAATSKAPTSWCIVASSRSTALSTVAMPRMICAPKWHGSSARLVARDSAPARPAPSARRTPPTPTSGAES